MKWGIVQTETEFNAICPGFTQILFFLQVPCPYNFHGQTIHVPSSSVVGFHKPHTQTEQKFSLHGIFIPQTFGAHCTSVASMKKNT